MATDLRGVFGEKSEGLRLGGILVERTGRYTATAAVHDTKTLRIHGGAVATKQHPSFLPHDRLLFCNPRGSGPLPG